MPAQPILCPNLVELSALFAAIRDGDDAFIDTVMSVRPELARLRSADGRGPLFWAREYGRARIAAKLVAAGADADARDAHGLAPGQPSIEPV